MLTPAPFPDQTPMTWLQDETYGASALRGALPTDADPDAISASLRSGLLTAAIARSTTAIAQKRMIAIDN